jgi:antitoxin HicB
MKEEYPFVIRPLCEEEGRGYLIEYPDLPGCMSDGKTPEEAIANGRDAVESYVLSCRKYGDKIPKPGASASGQWRQRVPKSMHSRLVARAKREGVSLNTLVTAMIAEGLGRRKAR